MWLDRAPFYAVALLAVGLAVPAAANHEGKTEPKGGAVSLPPGTELGAPFERGREVRITSGYGPDGGSSYHDGLDDACCTNDHYALDFALNDQPNNGKGEPVVAAADGIVRKAGRGTKGWSSYGLRAYLEHDFGDGHRYTSLYAHLYKYNVRPGQKVKRGDLIGFVGSTGRSQAPHLHYEIFKDEERINPLNFYYGHLSPAEYDEIVQQAQQENQSLD